ncbi:MAG: hypothetical protein A2511_01805 [Deltaproteobacteria bacterium RIFOXYD12_FULL_50_9]|nr:MAG: hypothetical protein A2511_01805 [Deltaproteobacteria bacterium RIFOXYD12_FULL_50_9]
MAFLEETEKRFAKKVAGISSEILNRFVEYSWPGNVRQLQREVERLVALTPAGEYVQLEKCSPDLLLQDASPLAQVIFEGLMPGQIKSLEIQLIKSALEQNSGNRMRAARQLGITRQGLHKKMKRYGIEV